MLIKPVYPPPITLGIADSATFQLAMRSRLSKKGRAAAFHQARLQSLLDWPPRASTRGRIRKATSRNSALTVTVFSPNCNENYRPALIARPDLSKIGCKGASFLVLTHTLSPSPRAENTRRTLA